MPTPNERYQLAKRATLNSAAANTILALLKIIVGYFGHSYALFADGIHSFSDLVTDALVLVAARAGGRLPDKEHPYGHHRIETIATIILAFVLIAAALLIFYDAAKIVWDKKPETVPEYSVIWIAALSIAVNEWLYHYTARIGKKINSNLLISNAWHHRSDALTSIIVFFSIIGTLLGFHHLDAAGALIVSLFILKIGIEMIYNGVKELIDTAVDEETYQKLVNCIQKVSGVRAIHQLRTRLHGGNIFIDVHIIVNPFISVSEGHYIGEHVRLSLLKKFKNVSDVTVHIDSEDDEKYPDSIYLPTRNNILPKLKECWQELPGYQQIKKKILHYLKGEIYIELFIPLSAIQNENPQRIAQQYSEAVKNMTQPPVHITVHFTPE